MNEIEQGKSEFETGRWSKALRLFKKALEGRNDSAREVAEVKVLMARCLSQLGEPEQAEGELHSVKPVIPADDSELLEQFETAWREVEDTRRLKRQEIERRRAQADE